MKTLLLRISRSDSALRVKSSFSHPDTVPVPMSVSISRQSGIQEQGGEQWSLNNSTEDQNRLSYYHI